MLRESFAGQHGGRVGSGIGRRNRPGYGGGIGVGAQTGPGGGRAKDDEDGQSETFHGFEFLAPVYFGNGFWMRILIYQMDSLSSHE